MLDATPKDSLTLGHCGPNPSYPKPFMDAGTREESSAVLKAKPIVSFPCDSTATSNKPTTGASAHQQKGGEANFCEFEAESTRAQYEFSDVEDDDWCSANSAACVNDIETGPRTELATQGSRSSLSDISDYADDLQMAVFGTEGP